MGAVPADLDRGRFLVTARGLRQGAWSVQELERLRRLLPLRGVDGAAALLRRSPESVRKRASQLLKAPTRRGEWSESDDAALRLAWGAVEPRLLGTMLGRATADVVRRANALRSRLRSGEWAHEDELMLKRLHGTRSDADLEVCLLRSAEEIGVKADELCLRKDKRFVRAASNTDGRSSAPRWTDDEIARLRSLYRDRDNLEVARLLGRSVVSVANKAWQLGLQKSQAALAKMGRANVSFRFRAES